MVSFSVIIPNYNHAKYLPECLDAILSQSLQPSDILVVDDGSTDESCSVIADYQKRFSHLRLLKLEKNSGGPIVPVREGLKQVSGDFVALCASDDMIQPGFFQEAIEVVSEHPDLAICFGKFVVFEDQKPYRFQDVALSLINSFRVFSPDEWVSVTRKYHLDIPSQSALYQRALLMQVGGYDEQLKGYSDYYLNYQLSFQYPVAYVPRVWGANRIVRNSYGRDLPSEERARLCANLIKKLESEPKTLRARWRRSGILDRAGRGMFYFLIKNIRYWKYLPCLLLKYSCFRAKKYLYSRRPFYGRS